MKKVNKDTQIQSDYFKSNYNAIRNKLTNINWEQTLSRNFGNSYQLFLELLTTSMEGFVPNRMPHNKYMNSNAIKHKNKKQKLWKTYTLSRRDTDYVSFVKCKNELRSVTRKLRKMFEISLASRSKSSPKMFWWYVNSKLKTRTKIPTLKNSSGTVASREKAEALNNFFGSIY